MAVYLNRNPHSLLKLSATAMALKTAVAKLHSHYNLILAEQKKDKEYYENYLVAYLDCNEEEVFAEKLSTISHEADQLMIESHKGNDNER